MTAYDEQDAVKNRVRETADIVQVIGECVELKRAGTRYSGLCPFHAEKTPSFSVNPQGQFFHCFGCGESGDVFSFMMKYHHLSFPEALKELARRYQIDLPERRLSPADQERVRRREELYRANEEAATLYQHYLLNAPQGNAARSYLEGRGVTEHFIREYRLGFAPSPEMAGWSYAIDHLRKKKVPLSALEEAGLAVKKDRGGYYDRFRNRILFPILDMTGRVAAFSGRILDDGKPKYMNSPESPVFDKSRLLFGLYQHKESIRDKRYALVVEGNFDLLLLAVHGIDNVVAPLGTALTRQHVRSLRGYCDEVILLFDGDAAGLQAALRSVPFFLAEQVEGKVALLPQGHDPDTLIREKGPAGIRELTEVARPLAEFVFDALGRQYGLTLSGKSRIISELNQMLKASTDPGQRSLMIAHFSEKLGISPAQFRLSAADPTPGGLVRKHRSSPGSFLKLPRRQRQLVDFLILYPEFLVELREAGLDDAVQEPMVQHIIDHLQLMSAEGICAPEHLLSMLVDPEEKGYVARLLMQGGGEDDGDREGQGKRMCAELIAWIVTYRESQSVADLQQQIIAAQQSGDQALVMELLQSKQKMMQKRQDY